MTEPMCLSRKDRPASTQPSRRREPFPSRRRAPSLPPQRAPSHHVLSPQRDSETPVAQRGVKSIINKFNTGSVCKEVVASATKMQNANFANVRSAWVRRERQVKEKKENKPSNSVSEGRTPKVGVEGSAVDCGADISEPGSVGSCDEVAKLKKVRSV